MRFEERVEELLKSYRKKTEDQLILICYRKIDSCEEHVAAQLALAEKRKAEADKANNIQKSTSDMTLWILLLTVALLLLTLFQQIFPFISGQKTP